MSYLIDIYVLSEFWVELSQNIQHLIYQFYYWYKENINKIKRGQHLLWTLFQMCNVAKPVIDSGGLMPLGGSELTGKLLHCHHQLVCFQYKNYVTNRFKLF